MSDTPLARAQAKMRESHNGIEFSANCSDEELTAIVNKEGDRLHLDYLVPIAFALAHRLTARNAERATAKRAWVVLSPDGSVVCASDNEEHANDTASYWSGVVSDAKQFYLIPVEAPNV